jgi:hypothetical protein
MDGEGTGREDIMAEAGEGGWRVGKVEDGPMVKREDGVVARRQSMTWQWHADQRHGSSMWIDGVAVVFVSTSW